MPKIKTHKSASKRLGFTGSGKLRGLKMRIGHRSRFKSKRALREAGSALIVAKGHAKSLRKVVGK